MANLEGCIAAERAGLRRVINQWRSGARSQQLHAWWKKR